jgi:hypothetical protein
MKAGGWVNLFLGAWLAASPLVISVDPTLSHSNEIAGIVMVLLAGWSLAVSSRKTLAGWLCLLAAFWIFCSPYALAVVDGSVALANNGIIGALMMIFAVVRTLTGPPLPGEQPA